VQKRSMSEMEEGRAKWRYALVHAEEGERARI
jgi:hypothetical protein